MVVREAGNSREVEKAEHRPVATLLHYLPIIYLSVCLSVCLSIYVVLCVCVSVCVLSQLHSACGHQKMSDLLELS